MRAIRAKFESAIGTLTITMPKKSQVDPKAKSISKSEEAAKTTTLEAPLRPQRDTMDKQPRYGKIQEDTTDRFTSDPKRRSEVDDKITTTTTTTVQSPRPQETSARVPLPGQAQKDYIDTPRPEMIAHSESEYEYGKKGSKEPTPQKGGVAAAAAATPDPKATSSTSGMAEGVEKQQDKKERAIGSKTSAPKRIVQEEGINARKESEPKGRPKMTEIVMEKPIIMQTKEKDSSSLKNKPENVVMKKAGKKEKDSTIEGTVGAQKEEKAKDYSYFAKVKQITDASSSGGSGGGGGGDGFELEKYKQAVQRVVGKGGLSLTEEERQLVVNVGAALLVIVALGVYIYYT